MAYEPFSLDIETAGANDGYALEPWRYAQGKGYITSTAVCLPSDTVIQVYEPDRIVTVLEDLRGQEVWVHNGLFDVAWLLNYAPKSILNEIKWRDTMLGMKWLLNGQKAERRKFSYALDNIIDTFLKNLPDYEGFIALKKMDVKVGARFILENGEDYWPYRGRLDAQFTRELGKFVMSHMPDSMKEGFYIECECIVPLAESWLHGIRLDREKNEALKSKVKISKANIAKFIDKPQAMFTSPKQLNHYLFNELGLPVLDRTPKGAPSCGKETLMKLYYQTAKDPRLKAIIDFKNIATMESKFINGTDKCSEHNGSNHSHASPRLFGTITGRMTYSNKTLKKYFIGLAQHQIPREGPIKGQLQAEEGEYVVQFDANAQELRFIAQTAKEQNMIRSFNNGIDLHSDMASSIAGWAYEQMMKQYHGEKSSKEYIEAFNFRQAGKLTNLSCQYRIGASSLMGKFFSTYEILIDFRTAQYYLNMYKRQYPGVVEYWDTAIDFAKANGYAESISGRRFKINEWGRNSWMSESNAINHPIQGSGADHMELAVATMNREMPEVRLLTVMHDGIYWAIKNVEQAQQMHEVLNSINYAKIWNKEVYLEFPFDGEIGLNFKETKEFTYNA